MLVGGGLSPVVVQLERGLPIALVESRVPLPVSAWFSMDRDADDAGPADFCSLAAVRALDERDSALRREAIRPKPGPLAVAEYDAAAANRPGLDLAWVLPGAWIDEHAAVDVLCQHLTNPVDGRLQRTLTQAGCWPARWRHDLGRSSGQLVLSLDLTAAAVDADAVRGAGRTAELEQVVLAALQRAGDSIPSEIELNRARALAAREVRFRLARGVGLAGRAQASELVADAVRLTEWRLLLVNTVRVGDVQRAAASLLEARRAAPPNHLASEPTPRGDPRAAREPAVVTQLNPRVRIVVRRLSGAPLTWVETRLHGRQTLHGTADALMSLGTTRHSVGELREYLSLHGLDLLPLSDVGPAGLVSRGPASHAAQLIELHAELVRGPDTTPNAQARAAETGRTLARRLAEAPPTPGEELYLPPGMYGWRVGEPPVTDADLIAQDLAALQTLRYVEVHVAGDVELDDVARAVEDAWGDWRPEQ